MWELISLIRIRVEKSEGEGYGVRGAGEEGADP